MARTRWRLAAALLTCLGGGAVALLIVTNPAPRVPESGRVAGQTLPYIVKLHARWCPICMATKDEWASVQAAYVGRVRFVVFDFTSSATTEASRVEARQLGLDAVFEEYAGETGTVLVVDAESRKVRHALHGLRSVAEYGAAIDASLIGTRQ